MVLTDRHREVLRLTAQGLRAREVAKRLWLSESTVKQHLAEVRWRLHAPNTTRALVIALLQGELSLAELAGDQSDSVTIGSSPIEAVTTTNWRDVQEASIFPKPHDSTPRVPVHRQEVDDVAPVLK